MTKSTTLVYRSKWSSSKPLHYSDDTSDRAVNKLVDKLFKTRTKRLVVKNNKYYYCPSEEYKQFIIKIKFEQARSKNQSRKVRCNKNK